jgi:hypothetical protein
VTFSLARIPFPTIVDHLRRNAGRTIPARFGALPWIYLSGFYARRAQPGAATTLLRQTLAAIPGPFILCCEPILGTDPRSITAKNADLTPDQRYEALQGYYCSQFGLTAAVRTDCTLRVAMTGRGPRWSDARRHLMLGIQGIPPDPSPDAPTSDGSRAPCDLLCAADPVRWHQVPPEWSRLSAFQ